MPISEFNASFYAVAALALVLLGLLVWGRWQGVLVRQQLQQAQSHVDALSRKLRASVLERNEIWRALAFSPDGSDAQMRIRHLVHEINQPLGAIRLYAEHLLYAPELSGPEKEEICQQITQGTERAQQCLRDFRATFPSAQQTHRPLALDALVQEVVDDLAVPWREAGIALTLDLPPAAHVVGDAMALKMLLLNLFSNALEALREHAGERRVHLRAAVEDGWLCGVIQDSGPAVPPERQGALFERDLGTRPAGARQGLWLCRAIVAWHGGELVANLNHAQVSFEFKLPMAQAREEK